jgi:hypothetical protein
MFSTMLYISKSPKVQMFEIFSKSVFASLKGLTILARGIERRILC